MCIRSRCIVKYVNIIILHTIQAGYDILSRLLMGQLSVNKFDRNKGTVGNKCRVEKI